MEIEGGRRRGEEGGVAKLYLVYKKKECFIGGGTGKANRWATSCFAGAHCTQLFTSTVGTAHAFLFVFFR